LSESALPPIDDSRAPAADLRAAEELLPLLYTDVRRLARHERLRVSAGNTLQTTALIHEAYLKLYRTTTFNDRAHFLRSAALAMRHVLVNHARDRLTLKRGSGAAIQSLDTAAENVAGDDDRSLVDIHEALRRLAELDERLARVVECRFFGGYSEEDTAIALGVTDRTVRRDWIKARAWLRNELAGGALEADDDSD
jgi:RNA polymerase sigma factor (TIGR02999 family)